MKESQLNIAYQVMFNWDLFHLCCLIKSSDFVPGFNVIISVAYILELW